MTGRNTNLRKAKRRGFCIEPLEDRRLLAVEAFADPDVTPFYYDALEDSIFGAGAAVLVATESTWDYLDELPASGDGSYPVDDESDTWNSLDFDVADTAANSLGNWDSGDAMFVAGVMNGFPGGGNTALGGTQGTPNAVNTYLFRTTMQLDAAQAASLNAAAAAGSVDAITASLFDDDSGILYINGTEVMRDNISDPVDSTSLADGNGNEVNFHDETVDLTGVTFFEGDNAVAFELHQAGPGSSDAGFDLELTATFTTVPSVLANDLLDGNPIVPADMGTVVQAVLTDITPAGGGLVDLQPDGRFTFTPDPDYFNDPNAPNDYFWFTYMADDGTGQSDGVNVGEVRIRVAPVNDAPMAMRDYYTGTEGETIDASFAFGDPAAIIPPGADWFYDDTGAAPTAGWQTNGLGAIQGPAKLGFGGGTHETTTLTGGNSAYYFFRAFDASVIPDTLYLALKRDDGAVVYINGTEVYRDGNIDPLLNPVPNDYRTATTSPDDGEEFALIEVDNTGNLLNLQAVGNAIAVEVHQLTGSNTDISFDLQLSANAGRIGLLANDSDVEDANADLSVVVAPDQIDPAVASLTVNEADGTFVFDPVSDYLSGTFTFDYQTVDSEGGTSAMQTATITLAAIDAGPIVTAADDVDGLGDPLFVTDEDTDLVVDATTYPALANPMNSNWLGVLANDTTVVEDYTDPITLSVDTAPANGTVTLNDDGTFTYVPDANWFGVDSFYYIVNDGFTDSNPAMVEITVNAVNDAPVGTNDFYMANEGETIYADTAQPILVIDPLDPTVPLIPIGSDWRYSDYYVPDDGDPLTLDDPSDQSHINDGTTAPAWNGPAGNGFDPDTAAGWFKTIDDPENPGTFIDVPNVGPAELGFGNGPVTVLTRTVNDITYYFQRTFTLEETDLFSITDLDVLLKVDDGAIVYINGEEAFRHNMPQDDPAAIPPFAVDFETLAVGTASNIRNPDNPIQTEDEYVAYRVDVSSIPLVASTVGTNTIAVEVHQGSAGSSDISFDLQLSLPDPGPVPNRFGVMANDAGDAVEQDLVTARIIDATSLDGLGTFTFNDDGTFEFEPNAGLHGTYTFTYELVDAFDDGQGNDVVSAPITATLTWLSEDDGPVVAVDDLGLFATDEDVDLIVDLATYPALTGPMGGGVLANDTTAPEDEGDALTLTVDTAPTNGTVTLNNDGSFTYVPDANWFGADEFWYIVNDGFTDSDPAKVEITVNSVNDVPTGTQDYYTGTEGDTIVASFAFSDPAAIIPPGANWFYDDSGVAPAAGWQTAGLGAIAGPAKLGFGTGTNEATTLAGGNAAYYFFKEFDVTGVPNTLYLSLKRDDGAVVYINGTEVYRDSNIDPLLDPVPFDYLTPDFSPDDGEEFALIAVDNTGNLLGLQATGNAIAVEVHQYAPVQIDISFDLQLSENPGRIGLLPNDAGDPADGDPVTAVLVDASELAGLATLALNTDGTFVFTPTLAGLSGPFTFTYALDDGNGGVSDPIPVTITLALEDDGPVTVANDLFFVPEDVTLIVDGTTRPDLTGPGENWVGLLNNDDTAPEDYRDPLTLTLVPDPNITDPLDPRFERAQPLFGTAVLNGDGSFTYTPDGGPYTGNDSFWYTVNDGFTDSDPPAKVTLLITEVNDPAVAVDDAYTTVEETELVANLARSPDPILDAGSTWRYLDDLNNGEDGNPVEDYPVFTHTDTTEYQWNEPGFSPDNTDGSGADSAGTWLEGDGPFGHGGLTGIPNEDIGTDLPNGFDAVNGNTNRITTYLFRKVITVVDGSSITSVNARLLSDDGGVLYVNGVEILRLPTTQADPIETTTTMSGTGESYANYSIDVPLGTFVDGDNTVAYEAHQMSTTSSDMGFDLELTPFFAGSILGVLDNDFDEEGDPFDVIEVAGVSIAGGAVTTTNATVTMNADGTFSYLPNDDFQGVDMFEYTLTGGETGTVAVTVTNTPDAPVAVDDARTTGVDVPLDANIVDLTQVTAANATEVVALGSVWKYLDDGSDQGAAWTDPDAFDDSSWASGPAELGYGEGDEATVVGYGPDAGNKYATTYFRHAFDVAPAIDVATLAGLVLRVGFDDSVAVYLNGVEIARDRLPAGAAYDTYAGGGEIIWSSVSVDPALLRQTGNVLAAEVHQANATSSDVSFNAELLIPEPNVFSLLVNDVDVDGDTVYVAAAGVGSDFGDLTIMDEVTGVLADVATAQGGLVTVNADGTFLYTPAAGFEGEDSFNYAIIDTPNDTGLLSDVATVTITVGDAVPSAEVVGRNIFYNGSYWDGNDAGASAADDSAIAPSPADLTAAGEDPGLGKTALLPGETATFQNYTNYTKGINGVMVDVQDLGDAGGLSAADFTFEAGNSGFAGLVFNPTAPADIVDVRAGAGVSGSDRVTLIWSDANAVKGLWLRVTVAANANTGLVDPDVFYFGNAPGETGNVPGSAKVDGSDAILARDNTTGFFNPPALENPYDFNRDHRVDGFDAIFARDNTTGFFDTLALITAPSPAPIESAVGEGAPESLGFVSLPLADTAIVRRESVKSKPVAATAAIDSVLANSRYLTVQNSGRESLLDQLAKRERAGQSAENSAGEELLDAILAEMPLK